MTSWVKLHLIVEGETERVFARDALKPQLAGYHVSVDAFMFPTNQRRGKAGGALSWDRFQHNLSRLLKQHANASDRFSTMIDWYRLDPGFPGYAKARRLARVPDRVLEVERSVAEHFGSSRLFPFFTLHEFEALLFCDLSQLATRMPDTGRGVVRLESELRDIPPEAVNDGAETHPSARLEKHLPGYRRAKVRVGAPAATAIGLPRLREACPHFGQWLTRLERLAAQP